MKKIVLTSVAALAAAGSALAQDAAPENGLVKKESGRGPWTVLIGPAWRSNVKLSTHGTIYAPQAVANQTYGDERDMTQEGAWTNPQLRDNPNFDTDQQNPKLWGVAAKRTEVIGVAGSDYRLDRSDDNAPIGANVQFGYDFLRGETWSLGLSLRFAGYWNMNSSSKGYYNAGGYLTQSWNDWHTFNTCEGNSTFQEDVGQYADFVEPTYSGDSEIVSEYYTDLGSRLVNTHLRSDLYQIGLGPKVTWSPFVGWCDWMDWLDVYGCVEILCNIAHNEFEADGNETAQTDCLIGFGGNVGLVGNITDWLGIYGQIGYEWVDKSDVSTGGFSADVDYSSLVLSAGLLFAF